MKWLAFVHSRRPCEPEDAYPAAFSGLPEELARFRERALQLEARPEDSIEDLVARVLEAHRSTSSDAFDIPASLTAGSVEFMELALAVFWASPLRMLLKSAEKIGDVDVLFRFCEWLSALPQVSAVVLHSGPASPPAIPALGFVDYIEIENGEEPDEAEAQRAWKTLSPSDRSGTTLSLLSFRLEAGDHASAGKIIRDEIGNLARFATGEERAKLADQLERWASGLGDQDEIPAGVFAEWISLLGELSRREEALARFDSFLGKVKGASRCFWDALRVSLLMKVGRLAEAEELGLRLEKNAVPGSEDRARALCALGRVLWQRGNFSEAKIILAKAAAIEPKSKSVESEILFNQASCAYSLQDYSQALAFRFSALRLSRDLERPYDEACNLYNLASVQYDLDLPDRVDHFLAQARFMARRFGYRFLLAGTHYLAAVRALESPDLAAASAACARAITPGIESDRNVYTLKIRLLQVELALRAGVREELKKRIAELRGVIRESGSRELRIKFLLLKGFLSLGAGARAVVRLAAADSECADLCLEATYLLALKSGASLDEELSRQLNPRARLRGAVLRAYVTDGSKSERASLRARCEAAGAHRARVILGLREVRALLNEGAIDQALRRLASLAKNASGGAMGVLEAEVSAWQAVGQLLNGRSRLAASMIQELSLRQDGLGISGLLATRVFDAYAAALSPFIDRESLIRGCAEKAFGTAESIAEALMIHIRSVAAAREKRLAFISHEGAGVIADSEAKALVSRFPKEFTLLVVQSELKARECSVGEIDFTTRPLLFQLLCRLLSAPGHHFSKESLYREFWGGRYNPEIHDNNIYQSMLRLRESLGDKLSLGKAQPDRVPYILSDKRGYGFNPRARFCYLSSLTPKGLSPRQQEILMTIESGGGMRARDLLAKQELTRSSLNRDLSELLSRGLIIRRGTYRGTTYFGRDSAARSE